MEKLQSVITFFVLLVTLYPLMGLSKLLGWVLTPCKTKERSRRILFLEVFPVENTGYQYRAAKWADIFNRYGYRAEVKTLIKSKRRFDSMIGRKHLTAFFICSVFTRFWQCLYARSFDTVIVRRELLLFNDYGNLFMEKFLLKIHSNVILDFDDDISASKREPRSVTSLFGKLLLENGNKFTESLKLYKRFVVGSEYLAKMLSEKRGQEGLIDMVVIPTCVDYEQHAQHVFDTISRPLRLGWVGIPENLTMFDILLDSLNELSKEFVFELIIISSKAFNPPGVNFRIINYQWDWHKEIEYLNQIDIGLMPLHDNPTTRGKCGFKLIQYMGLGIPGIASAVTVNNEIISDPTLGWLVPVNESWLPALRSALSCKNEELTAKGNCARQHIYNNYSFKAHTDKYLDYIDGH